jgi:hypothetical protein
MCTLASRPNNNIDRTRREAVTQVDQAALPTPGNDVTQQIRPHAETSPKSLFTLPRLSIQNCSDVCKHVNEKDIEPLNESAISFDDDFSQ